MDILVGMSGGVDSSVVATKLKEAGHNLVAAMMCIYKGETKCDALNSCYGISKECDIEQARLICNKLDIPFHLIDCSKEFNELVFRHFKEEYANGRTPNPCVLCNPLVKFGILPDAVRKLGIKFDKFATGHYAQVEYCKKSSRYLIKRGLEHKKDQSYFLYGLSQEQLSHTLFPLGAQLKVTTRAYAQEYGLLNYDKADSQDFYKGDYNDILEILPKEGVICLKDGTVLGLHNGVHNYTIGQRKGIGVAYSQPLYVLELDPINNKVIVGIKDDTFCDMLVAKNLNWVAFETLNKKIFAKAKHRSTQEPQACYIEPIDNDKILIKFSEKQSSITLGQSVVIYDDDLLLGGGIICEVSRFGEKI